MNILMKEVGIGDEGEGECFGCKRVLWECFWERGRRKIIWYLIEKYSSEKAFKGPNHYVMVRTVYRKGSFEPYCGCISVNGPNC